MKKKIGFILLALLCTAGMAGGGHAFDLKKLGDKVKQKTGGSPGGTNMGGAVGGGSPYLAHREKLIPYTGLGATPKSKYFDSIGQALGHLKPMHDRCISQPAKQEINKSNYKVWPSYKREISHCVKLLADKDGKMACYVIELDCKKKLPGQTEPKPGEWGPDYDRCDTNYDSSYRWHASCPDSF